MTILETMVKAVGEAPAGGTARLATIRFEPVAVPKHGRDDEVVVPARCLDEVPQCEVWPAAGRLERWRSGPVSLASDGRLLFAAVAAEGAGGDGLEAVTHATYRRLLPLVEGEGYPHLLRVWNFVPAINGVSLGIERYKLFCKARSEAYAAHYGLDFQSRLPAASAVGCRGEYLVVHMLAAKEQGRPLENPRQTSAYHYPVRYGPRSPSFARATVAPKSVGGGLLISGTASIVGHDSVHPDDAGRQTEETMRNIEVLLDAAGVPGAGGPLGRRLRLLRVYVRHPDHVREISETLARTLADPVPTIFVEADVCRSDLLVEIEGIAAPPPP